METFILTHFIRKKHQGRGEKGLCHGKRKGILVMKTHSDNAQLELYPGFSEAGS